jgi:hypothetical protein
MDTANTPPRSYHDAEQQAAGQVVIEEGPSTPATSGTMLSTLANDTIPYFRLPPELRVAILELVLPLEDEGVLLGRCGRGIPQEVKGLFRVCRQMYADALPVYYRDVCIDLQGYGSASPALRCVNRFLRTARTPRRHVRRATVLINLIDCCNCESLGRLALARYCGSGGGSMEEEGDWEHELAGLNMSSNASPGTNGTTATAYPSPPLSPSPTLDIEVGGGLRCVNLDIGPDFPYPPYGCYLHPAKRDMYHLTTQLNSGAQATGPLCVTKPPFQTFLAFLQHPGFGTMKVRLNRFHLEFLCAFHQPHPADRACKGEWRGSEEWLELDHLAMIRAFAGAQVDRFVKPYHQPPLLFSLSLSLHISRARAHTQRRGTSVNIVLLLTENTK